jgi:hypothetical protein
MNNEELKNRVNEIVNTCDKDDALNRLLGYMSCFYGNVHLCEMIGTILIEKGRSIEAGKYIFFKNELTKSDIEIIDNYFESFGNNKINILRDLLGNDMRSPKNISSKAKRRLFNIMNDVKQVNGILPKFTLNWYNHFKANYRSGD